MPNFSTDADLLPHEPSVFHELPFAGQTLVRLTDAALDGATVTSAAGGLAILSPGHVAILGDGAYAIAQVVDDNTLMLAAAPVGAGDGTLTVRTFAPQAALVHGELLRALGIDPDDPDPPFDASAIVSTALAARLEALGTLAGAYAGGVSVEGNSQRYAEKALRHRTAFTRLLHLAAIQLDLGGDGDPDTVRYPGVGQWLRT